MRAISLQTKSYFGEPSIGAWTDDVFMAVAFQDEAAIRLDICRLDLKDGVTWDELQALKNACGFADYDGIEFYPRKADVINTGNIRHLYLFKEPLPLIRRK